MQKVMDEKYRVEMGASYAMDEVLRKVKRITVVDDDDDIDAHADGSYVHAS
jgi:uncharacterized Zn ribbon protein